jgi:hypothetical protein
VKKDSTNEGTSPSFHSINEVIYLAKAFFLTKRNITFNGL